MVSTQPAPTSWSKRASEMGPISVKPPRRWRPLSGPPAKGNALARVQVDGAERLLHGRDRLDGHPQIDRLAVGDAPGEPTRAVAGVTETALAEVDLVVKGGARPRRAFEAGAELHPLHRVDAED